MSLCRLSVIISNPCNGGWLMWVVLDMSFDLSVWRRDEKQLWRSFFR